MTVKLDRVRRCLGKTVYSRLTSTYVGEPLPGDPRRTSVTRYPCPRVYYPVSDTIKYYRPHTLYFGANGSIQNAKWRRWSTPVASGRGRLRFNDCVPYCARGRITLVPVAIRLSDLGFCDSEGEIAYRKLTFTIVGRKPLGALRRQAVSLRYVCSSS